MITYEATICCDGCDKMVSGFTKTTPLEAQHDAQDHAWRRRWILDTEGDYCPKCVEKFKETNETTKQ